MKVLATVRHWTHVLLDEPQFPTYRAGFEFLAAADARREKGDCGCRSVAHALSLRDRASVTTALQVARDQGRADLVAYLSARLDRCPTTDPSVEQMLARARADLRNAREVTQ